MKYWMLNVYKNAYMYEISNTANVNCKQCFIVIYFTIKLEVFLICNLMSIEMFCEVIFSFESFLALVALEWPLPSVFPRVFLQVTRCRGSVVALLTFEWPFSRMQTHNVNFQGTSCDARILAQCASVWLFSRVRPLVRLQCSCFCCFIFTLIAIVLFFPGVFL